MDPYTMFFLGMLAGAVAALLVVWLVLESFEAPSDPPTEAEIEAFWENIKKMRKRRQQ